MQHSTSFRFGVSRGGRASTGWVSSGLGLLIAGTGCGTQVSSGYLGEALLTLSGSVIVDRPDAPRDLVPVLAFDKPRGDAPPNALLLQDVEHTGEFPSRFRLGVFEPPADAALFDVETASGARLRYAWARIGAVAPEHPSVLAQTNLGESSYCLGRECYTERSRCDLSGECYREREHCSLPSWFDARGVEESLCSEVATGGDIAAVPASPHDYSRYEDDHCEDGVCEHTYEWCRNPPDGDACVEQPDASCRPAPENCFSRTVACVEDTNLPMLPPELDEMRWMERDDLTNCGIVSRQGNLDYAANPNEWLAGLSEDVNVVYVPEGFDAAAFEEVLMAPPDQSGFSVLVLEPWNDSNLAAYDVCNERTQPALIDAYNREHGTSFSLDAGVAADTELGIRLLEGMFRCSREVRGRWQPGAVASGLTLDVSVPPVYE
jgi:hypothetical protein